jgi:predicted metal-dependent enzyme (double-stranded beta helix superfamily)
MSAALRPSPDVLTALLDGVAGAVSRSGCPRAVADCLARHVADPDLLAGCCCPSSGDRYARHLLAEDPAGRYAVAALVWRPGQMSRVHSHRVWCALGVHRGVLAETLFEPDEVPCPRETRLCRPGAVSCGPADPTLIHRIANLGCEDAVSIHVYGLAFAEFPTGVNRLLSET